MDLFSGNRPCTTPPTDTGNCNSEYDNSDIKLQIPKNGLINTSFQLKGPGRPGEHVVLVHQTLQVPEHAELAIVPKQEATMEICRAREALCNPKVVMVRWVTCNISNRDMSWEPICLIFRRAGVLQNIRKIYSLNLLTLSLFCVLWMKIHCTKDNSALIGAGTWASWTDFKILLFSWRVLGVLGRMWCLFINMRNWQLYPNKRLQWTYAVLGKLYAIPKL